MERLGPFRLRPWFRTRVWGVRDLAPWYDYQVTGEPIGEVWLTGDDSVVDSGPLTGHRLSRVFQEHKPDLLGAASQHQERFPLLMKVLFPHEKLSVQVHPGDAMAREAGEPHGKTECWYALDAKPGASVALGLRAGTTLAQVRSAIDGNTLEPLLEQVPIENGDMIFVDAGTIHAINPDAVLLETQQHSDMTYRLYDYGRPRELHLEQGLKATRVQTEAGKIKPRIISHNGGIEHSVLIESKYFRVDRFRLTYPAAAGDFSPPEPSAGTVQLIFVAGGSGSLQGRAPGVDQYAPIHLKRGELAIVPACVDQWSIAAAEPMEVLRAVPM